MGPRLRGGAGMGRVRGTGRRRVEAVRRRRWRQRRQRQRRLPRRRPRASACAFARSRVSRPAPRCAPFLPELPRSYPRLPFAVATNTPAAAAAFNASQTGSDQPSSRARPAMPRCSTLTPVRGKDVAALVSGGALAAKVREGGSPLALGRAARARRAAQPARCGATGRRWRTGARAGKACGRRGARARRVRGARPPRPSAGGGPHRPAAPHRWRR
jgi:hypothetical protein